MSLAPEFWTNLTLHLDSEMFSASDFALHLQFPRDLVISVTITSGTNNLFFTQELEENQRARDITTVLGPHIHRCNSIHYKVIHSSSLPIISTDLYYFSPFLDNLRLEASALHGGCPSAGILHPSQGVRGEIFLPAFQYITLDGWNFVKLYCHNPHWTQKSVSLAIVHFRPSGPEEYVSLYSVFQFLAGIEYLHTLEITDVELKPEDTHDLDNGPRRLEQLQTITISHLKRPFYR